MTLTASLESDRWCQCSAHVEGVVSHTWRENDSFKTDKKMAFINQAARREQTNTVMWKHDEVKFSSWSSKMLQVAEPQPEAPLPVFGSASLLVAQGTTSDCWPPPHFYCDVAPNSSHPIVCNCSVPISPGAFLAEICKQNDCHLSRFCFWFFSSLIRWK